MRCCEANLPVVCDQCGAALHADCGRALGRCPTLGCGASLFPERRARFHEAMRDLDELGKLAALSTFTAILVLGAIAVATALCRAIF